MSERKGLEADTLDRILDNVHRRWHDLGVALTVVQQPEAGGQWAGFIGTRGKASGKTDWQEGVSVGTD
jgi:hypothetical protein